MKIGIIILAAGSSSRLGKPKQLLLSAEGKTLIREMAEKAIALHPEKVIVVLGFAAHEIQPKIQDLPLQILHNPDWEEGMASSIRSGIHQLQQDNYDAALLLVCDQVKVSTTLLENIIRTFTSSATALTCCWYAGQLGIPAMFGKSYFNQLMQLKGDKGAKQLIQQSPDKMIVNFEGGEMDIDEMGDLKWLT